MSVATLLTELRGLGIRLEADGDRLRFHPRSAVTSDLLEKIIANKQDLLANLRLPASCGTIANHPEDIDLGKCARCGTVLIETLTFDGFLNLECRTCDLCFGCRPSNQDVTNRFTGYPKPIPVVGESGEVLDHVEPCHGCGEIDFRWDARGRHCQRCEPEQSQRQPNVDRKPERSSCTKVSQQGLF